MRDSRWDQSVVEGALEVRRTLPFWLKPETTREFRAEGQSSGHEGAPTAKTEATSQQERPGLEGS